jgi:hypothetical protein
MQHDRQTPLDPAQAELEQAEFAAWARIDLTAGGFAGFQDVFTQLMTPQRGDSQGQ